MHSPYEFSTKPIAQAQVGVFLFKPLHDKQLVEVFSHYRHLLSHSKMHELFPGEHVKQLSKDLHVVHPAPHAVQVPELSK